MLKSEIVELLADTYHGPSFDGPEGRARAIKILNREPKYALEARLELLTAPTAEREAAVQKRRDAINRRDRIGRARRAGRIHR